MIRNTRKTLAFLAAVLFISTTGLVSADTSLTESPVVGAVDKFCTVSNTFNNTCTIKAKTIRLTYDTVYESQNSLVFDNTQV
jgi:hypothetical protein